MVHDAGTVFQSNCDLSFHENVPDYEEAGFFQVEIDSFVCLKFKNQRKDAHFSLFQEYLDQNLATHSRQHAVSSPHALYQLHPNIRILPQQPAQGWIHCSLGIPTGVPGAGGCVTTRYARSG